jgi:hypothetical protein
MGVGLAQASSRKFPFSAMAYDVTSNVPGLSGLFMKASFQNGMKLQNEAPFVRNTSLSPNDGLI